MRVVLRDEASSSSEMGNVECVNGSVVRHGCGDAAPAKDRTGPSFIPPNREHVTYEFDCRSDSALLVHHGGPLPVSLRGFPIEPHRPPDGERKRLAPKWTLLANCCIEAARLRLCISGRVLVECEDDKGPATQPVCAFAVAARGATREQSLMTRNFVHMARTLTSGVSYGLYLSWQEDGSMFLCPRLSLLLENGDEVELLEDRLGPVTLPASFYTDFAIVDECGRNVQVDFIFRGLPGPDGKMNMSTLRTCIQDYTTFNNQVDPNSISVGNSGMSPHLPGATVHLQNLVISEDWQEVDETDALPPYPRDLDSVPLQVLQRAPEAPGVVLFEGWDARSSFLETSRSRSGTGGPAAVKRPEDEILKNFDQVVDTFRTKDEDPDRVKKFWHHIKYCSAGDRADRRQRDPNNRVSLSGEFWLSKEVVARKGVYLHCSSNLAQALTMCIAFRFRCSNEVVRLIAQGESGARILTHMHIPTSAILLGIERDQRNSALLRMFVEHQNVTVDDMTVSELWAEALTDSIVHQEIYDDETTLYYRVTLQHSDGTRQCASLEAPAASLEEQQSSAQLANIVDESPRFPTSRGSCYHNLSTDNRVFIYSSVAFESGKRETLDSPKLRKVAGGPDRYSLDSADASPAPATEEDWHSVGGAVEGEAQSAGEGSSEEDSEGEEDGMQDCEEGAETAKRDGGSKPGLRSSPRDRGKPASPRKSFDPNRVVPKHQAHWSRPLIDSVVLLGQIGKLPFKCK